MTVAASEQVMDVGPVYGGGKMFARIIAPAARDFGLPTNASLGIRLNPLNLAIESFDVCPRGFR
jgi:hypothetical protein